MISKRTIKILLVDNEPKGLSLNTLMLRSSSPYLKIEPFNSTSEALNSIRKVNFHILVTELEMPEIDGFHLIKEAKNLNPEIFSILITGKDISNLDLMISEFNIDTFIKKPYTFTRLLSEITIGIMPND